MAFIPLTKGAQVTVDECDLDFLSQYKWYLGPGGYAARRQGKTIFMHHYLVDVPTALHQVDHINGDRLDNRKANLRVCARIDNAKNRIMNKNNKSGFKGVYFFRPTKKWQSQIKSDTKRIHLGYFNSKEEAAEAYNRAALIHHREFARLNVI